MVHGALLAGVLAGRIFREPAALTDLKIEIVAMITLRWCMVDGPLMGFSASFWKARKPENASTVLSRVAMCGVNSKWLRGRPLTKCYLGMNMFSPLPTWQAAMIW